MTKNKESKLAREDTTLAQVDFADGTCKRLNALCETLVAEVREGKRTARGAITTMMLRAIRAGRDMRIAEELQERRERHLELVGQTTGRPVKYDPATAAELDYERGVVK